MENKITRVSTSNIDIQKKEESRNYNILVYIRVRPVLKSEFGKEVVVNPEDDVKLSVRITQFPRARASQ